MHMHMLPGGMHAPCAQQQWHARAIGQRFLALQQMLWCRGQVFGSVYDNPALAPQQTRLPHGLPLLCEVLDSLEYAPQCNDNNGDGVRG